MSSPPPSESDPTRSARSREAPGGEALAPGTVIAERYRIVRLLGRGGMGEVYRADDMRLDQGVALKFLPADMTARVVDRLNQEVRLARRISHPNVCRVHDLGEVDGQRFVSMELIDGEDLESLLRRIGRLPEGKAVEIGQQLCAGLGAAHEAGILHRDLKPANVMIDGRGQARIMDFGVACLSENDGDASEIAGTPHYMAPEVLRGEGASVRSDLFSLGLVMFETLAGEPVYRAERLEDLRRLHGIDQRVHERLAHVDPDVARIVMQCVHASPDARPSSTRVVSLALPGFDPLAAALAQGVTPSPEVIAAFGGSAGLSPPRGAAVVLALALGLVLIALANRRVNLLSAAAPPLPPEVLAFRAAEIVRELGWQPAAADRAYGFWVQGVSQLIEEHDAAPGRWDVLSEPKAGEIRFWYRQSTSELQVVGRLGRLGFSDPPPTQPGMLSLVLNSDGSLFQLDGIPVAPSDAPPAGSVDWDRFLAAAELDPARFVEVEPVRIPGAAFDERKAWLGSLAELPDVQVRLEVATYAGQPVHVGQSHTWSLPGRTPVRSRQVLSRVYKVTGGVVSALLMLASLGVGWRNIRRGRGDGKGALRIVLYVLTLNMIAWVARAHHVSDMEAEGSLLVSAISRSLFYALLCGLAYLAFEPTIRRVWPRSLTSWNRMLKGRVLDPGVGRDVLVGLTLGVFFALLTRVHHLLAGWLGSTSPPPLGLNVEYLLGARFVISAVALSLAEAVFIALMVTFFLSLTQVPRRGRTATLVGLFLLGAVSFPHLETDLGALDLVMRALLFVTHAFVAWRIGLLALTLTIFGEVVFLWAPIFSPGSGWYASGGHGVAIGAFVLALAAWAVATRRPGLEALAGRGLMGGPAAVRE